MCGLVRGELFDDPGTYGLMHERWNRIFYPMRYGLGMMRFPVVRLLGPGRQAVTLVGHSGATGTWLFHCPELDVVLTGTIDELHGRAIPFRFMPRALRAIHR
jgi:D-alanyl-D-alanine carboxypeptidase